MVSGQKRNMGAFLSVRTCLSSVKTATTLSGHRGPRSPPHRPSESLCPGGNGAVTVSVLPDVSKLQKILVFHVSC